MTTDNDLFFQMARATVYIEEIHSRAGATFPSVPQIASLLSYDDASRARDSAGPVSGYPVVCITVSGKLTKWRKIVQELPLIWGDIFHNPRWEPNIACSTRPCISYPYMPMLKFNL